MTPPSHPRASRWLGLAAALLALQFSTAAFAAGDEGLELARKNSCMACHGVDKKIVGPAFQAVAQKYKGDKAGAATIEASVRKGSTGKWGPAAMPANTTLKDADLKVLSQWVLSR